MSNVVVSVGVFQSLVSVAAGAVVGRSPVCCCLLPAGWEYRPVISELADSHQVRLFIVQLILMELSV